MMLAKLFVIAAPSGAGKTSLIDALVKSLDHLKISISYTTRPKRPVEENGINYHFVDEDEFKRMVAADLFLEYANVYGYYYGTSRRWVEKQLQAGIDVILEIDWQGAAQIRKLFPESISIFILPPSRETLEQRLHKRNQDSAETIARRLEEARNEMAHYEEFDYLVINETFECALEDLRSVIKASRLMRRSQKIRHQQLLQELTSGGLKI